MQEASFIGCWALKKKRSGIKLIPYSRKWMEFDDFTGIVSYSESQKQMMKVLVERSVCLGSHASN